MGILRYFEVLRDSLFQQGPPQNNTKADSHQSTNKGPRNIHIRTGNPLATLADGGHLHWWLARASSRSRGHFLGELLAVEEKTYPAVYTFSPHLLLYGYKGNNSITV